ncbi:MAG: hypothetical protein NT166_23265 [Candidatus Aminicenantes bacterium]|nr:hypothetical protein [Candidatus Aminicenantes bacterium]
MARTNKTIEIYLYREGLTLQDSKTDTLIKDQIGTYGYNDVRLEEGITMHGIVTSINQNLIAGRGEQLKLAVLVKDQFGEVRRKYSHLVEVLKSHFHNSKDIIKELALDDPIRQTIPTFVPRAINFYTLIINRPHLLAAAVIFGLTAEKLQEEINQVTKLLGLHKQHRILIGENQRLTKERDIKLEEFRRYMNEFKSILFMLFEKDNPQILERINVFVRNKRKPRTTPVDPNTVPAPTTAAAKPNAQEPAETVETAKTTGTTVSTEKV